MFDFNAHSPYHRRMWHYESDRPLSISQLVALGSLDARTAALLWLLIERHSSVIVSGPADPTAGAGKTTTLNALLGFLPIGSTLVYTQGMFEDFAFQNQVDAPTTCVLANEVSNHLRIYMWGQAARRLLRLPKDGFAIATSCHADTVDDVLSMLRDDLRMPIEDVRRLGIVVNIGFVGLVWPPRRRFLSVNFVDPRVPVEEDRAGHGPRTGLQLLPLAMLNEVSDIFIPATEATLDDLATILGMAGDELREALSRRELCLRELAQGRGVGLRAMRAAVDELAARERGEMPDAGTGDAADTQN
jgi:hypothetical protein